VSLNLLFSFERVVKKHYLLGYKLTIRKISTDTHRPLCDIENETLEHIFISCP
jgi:hypothetical protein